MEKTIVELDVRDDIANKNDPFQKIMEAIAPLNFGDVLILHAPFQPVPLFGVLSAKGFEYQSEELSAAHFKITFTKNK